jgi:hypothetical protein
MDKDRGILTMGATAVRVHSARAGMSPAPTFKPEATMHKEDAVSPSSTVDCGTSSGDVQVSTRITGITSIRNVRRERTPETHDVPADSLHPAADIDPGTSMFESLALTNPLRWLTVRNTLRVWMGVSAAVALTACREPASPVAAARVTDAGVTHAHAANGVLTAEQHAAIARVRHATTRFHDLAAAQEAGYTSQYPAGCAASPDGAQGVHYLNPQLVDATVDLLAPELVMYEPRKDGSMQLVGVDYVVPFTAWTSSEPPMLLGMPFMRNEPLGVWALHIWAWRPNPDGMFAMWNPQVSCAHAK